MSGMDKKRILHAIYQLALHDRRLNADSATIYESSVSITQGSKTFSIEVKEKRSK